MNMKRSRIEVRFSIPGQKSFARMWNDLSRVPEDMSPAFEKMADQFLENNKRTFDEQGPGWKPLAASTVKDRERQGFPGKEPILVRTGRLKDSLTDAHADGAVRRIRAQVMEIGTTIPYAIYHQTGNLNSTNYPVGTHPPKRAPIVVRATLRTKWQRTITGYLRDEMEKAMYER